MSASDCIFCKLVNGEIPSVTLFENDDFKVVLDAFPSGLGHTLVLPKKHAADAFDLDESVVAKAFALAAQTAKKVKSILNCDGVNILQNNGAAAGQTVFHFHIHVIPRYESDTVRFKWQTQKPAPEDAKRFAEAFRKA